MKTIKNKIQEAFKFDGWVNITVADVSSKAAQEMQKLIEMKRSAGEPVKALIDEFNANFAVREMRFHNIIPTVGRQRIAKALIAGIASTGEISVNKSALGTGTTTPVNGDTTLDTETYRKDIASLSQNANIAYFTAFYTASDTSGTFYEHGIFINGTASADTGVLLSRVLLNAPTGITKSGTETLTIEHQITLT